MVAFQYHSFYLTIYNQAMLQQILNLLLHTCSTLIACACLIRCLFQWQGINLTSSLLSPISAYLFLLSDWIILPLRRVLPTFKKLDSASLCSAYLVILVKILLLAFINSATFSILIPFALAFFDLIDLILSGLVGIIFASMILSWLAPGSPIRYLLSSLVSPLLKPIKRILPNIGQLDLSPLFLLLAVQILQIIVANLKASI